MSLQGKLNDLKGRQEQLKKEIADLKLTASNNYQKYHQQHASDLVFRTYNPTIFETKCFYEQGNINPNRANGIMPYYEAGTFIQECFAHHEQKPFASILFANGFPFSYIYRYIAPKEDIDRLLSIEVDGKELLVNGIYSNHTLPIAKDIMSNKKKNTVLLTPQTIAGYEHLDMTVYDVSVDGKVSGADFEQINLESFDLSIAEEQTMQVQKYSNAMQLFVNGSRYRYEAHQDMTFNLHRNNTWLAREIAEYNRYCISQGISLEEAYSYFFEKRYNTKGVDIKDLTQSQVPKTLQLIK